MQKIEKNNTIAGTLKSIFKFNNVMLALNSGLLILFLVITTFHVYTFYGKEYVTDQNQMEIRKDVQTINKRLLFALASNDEEVTQKQADELTEMVNKVQQISTKVGDIANASTGQAESVGRLDTHVSNIAAVGENNAATSEESSALSQELNLHPPDQLLQSHCPVAILRICPYLGS